MKSVSLVTALIFGVLSIRAQSPSTESPSTESPSTESSSTETYDYDKYDKYMGTPKIDWETLPWGMQDIEKAFLGIDKAIAAMALKMKADLKKLFIAKAALKLAPIAAKKLKPALLIGAAKAKVATVAAIPKVKVAAKKTAKVAAVAAPIVGAKAAVAAGKAKKAAIGMAAVAAGKAIVGDEVIVKDPYSDKHGDLKVSGNEVAVMDTLLHKA